MHKGIGHFYFGNTVIVLHWSFSYEEVEELPLDKGAEKNHKKTTSVKHEIAHNSLKGFEAHRLHKGLNSMDNFMGPN